MTTKTACITGDSYPHSGSELIRRLKAAVDRAEFPDGGILTQRRFAELIGIPKSTLHDWCYGPLVDQIRGFICGLERLDAPARSALLREICRECPRLHGSWLAHDPGSVRALLALAKQPVGFTLVVGRSTPAASLLSMAMAHSAGVAASGIAVHPPKHLVPVCGVSYLPSGRTAAQLRADVHLLLPETITSDARLYMFDGIWNAAPEVQPRILTLARTSNVIVSADIKAGLENLPRSPGVRMTEVVVAESDGNRPRLTVRIQSRSL